MPRRRSGVAGVVSQYFQDSGEIWSFSLVVTGAVDGQVGISYGRIIKDWEQFLQKAFKQVLPLGAQPPFYVEVGVTGMVGTVIPAQYKSQRVAAVDDVMANSEVVGVWDTTTEREFLLAAVNRLRNAFTMAPIDSAMPAKIPESVPA